MLLFAACATPPEPAPFPTPWVPVSREFRSLQWNEWEKLHGLSLASGQALTPPFSPLLERFHAFTPELSDSEYCSDREVRASLSELPDEWSTVTSALQWYALDCDRPQSLEDIEPWVLRFEQLMASTTQASLRKWLRLQWLQRVEQTSLFWASAFKPSQLLLETQTQRMTSESKSLPDDARGAWLIWIAQLTHSAGLANEADALRRHVLLTWPTDRATHIIQRRHPHSFPPDTTSLSPSELLSYAKALIKVGETTRSLAAAQRLFKDNSGTIKEEAAKLLEAIYRARAEPEKRFQWQLVNNRKKNTPPTKFDPPDAVREPEAYYSYARTLWNMNKTRQAYQLIEAAESVRDSIPAETLYKIRFLRTRIHMELNEWDQVVNQLSQLEGANDEQKKDRAWNLALAHLHLNQCEKASDELRKFLELEEKPLARTPAQFWLAFCSRTPHGNEEFGTTVRTILEENPISFYAEAALSFARMPASVDEHASAINIGTPSIEKTLVFLASPDQRLSVPPHTTEVSATLTQEFYFLLWTGQTELARVWLDQIPNKKIPPAWFSAIGHHIRTIPQLVEWRKDKKDLPHYFYPLYFPREHWSLIVDAAKRHNVDPYLILSLIRQESIFQEDAKSVANAMGVLQLLPETARETYRRLKPDSPLFGQPFYPQRLFDPAWSIELGTAYFSQILKSFQGSWIASIGAYNAGPQAMRHWLKTRRRENPLLFIELIPYAETRTYIQLVLRNYANYKRLFADQEPNLPLHSSLPLLQ